MSHRTTPTPAEFERRFRDDIRVGFNWDRFLSEKWPIELVTLVSHPDLCRCYTPWYVGAVADEVAYDDPLAAPMRLHDVPKAFEILSDERKSDIQEKVDKYRTETGLIHFAAPSYSLPDGDYFILDRNHRLSALALSEKPFEVELWNVRGPLEEDCLLDLHHWLKDKDEGELARPDN